MKPSLMLFSLVTFVFAHPIHGETFFVNLDGVDPDTGHKLTVRGDIDVDFADGTITTTKTGRHLRLLHEGESVAVLPGLPTVGVFDFEIEEGTLYLNPTQTLVEKVFERGGGGRGRYVFKLLSVEDTAGFELFSASRSGYDGTHVDRVVVQSSTRIPVGTLVPEPSSLALAGITSLIGVGLWRRKRKQQRPTSLTILQTKWIKNGLLLIAALCTCRVAQAERIRYFVPQVELQEHPSNPQLPRRHYLIASGYVETDGTLGTLSTENILSYSIEIRDLPSERTDPPRPYTFTDSNPQASMTVRNVIATETHLLLPTIPGGTSRLILNADEHGIGGDIVAGTGDLPYSQRLAYTNSLGTNVGSVDSGDLYAHYRNHEFPGAFDLRASNYHVLNHICDLSGNCSAIVASVPEPFTMGMLLPGIVALGLLQRRTSQRDGAHRTVLKLP